MRSATYWTFDKQFEPFSKGMDLLQQCINCFGVRYAGN